MIHYHQSELKIKFCDFEIGSDYYDVDLSKHLVSLSTPFTAFIPTGAANRPELASTEKGKVLFESFRNDLLKFVNEYKSWKEHPSIEDMAVL